jgi:hypothetical protein
MRDVNEYQCGHACKKVQALREVKSGWLPPGPGWTSGDALTFSVRASWFLCGRHRHNC